MNLSALQAVLEAERSLLATLIGFPEAIYEADLTPDDFAQPDHALIFRALLELRDKGVDVNIATVFEHLAGRVPVDVLTDIASSGLQLPSAVESMAQTVRHAAIRRRLADTGRKIMTIADEARDVEDGIAQIERVLNEALSVQTRNRWPDRMSDVLPEFMDVLFERTSHKGELPGVPTGSRDLDHVTGGYHPSELVIVAARPSMGKTAWMLHSALAAARKAVSVVFSIEMSRTEITERYLAMKAHVPLYNLRIGRIEGEQWTMLSSAADALSKPELYIDDTPSMTVSHIRGQLRRMRRKFPDLPMVAFVDYLQIVAEKGRSQTEEYGLIAAGLKAAAKELGCTVVTLCQLNRECEKRQDKRPVLSDVRGSGEIEQTADVVIGMYRDAYYNPDTDDKNICELIVLKHRNGPTGTVKMRFDEKRQWFADLSDRG